MQSGSSPVKIFISYSHRDIDFKKEIETTIFSGSKEWEVLSDDLLQPSSDWNEVLTRMRNEAEIFLLLVSGAYLASEKVRSAELPQIIQRAEEGSVSVIPVILERCDWQSQPFARYQALPKFGHPWSEMDDRQAVFSELRMALSSVLGMKLNGKATQIIRAAKEGKSARLDLSRCDLTFIPRDLLEMPWLEELNMQKNYLTRIENLDNLTSLHTLVLSNNEISKIENLDTLTQLTLLDLQFNNLRSIRNLEHNTQLLVLGLSSNKITNLEGITPLQGLRSVYLSHNALTRIDELKELPLLRRIVLTNTQIQSIRPLLPLIKAGLPVELKYSFKEEENGIFVKDNKSLSEPSIEVIEKGRDAILKYFHDAEMYGTRKLEILKLILVGNSKVGKTNFSEMIRGLAINPNHNSTHLLDIEQWETSLLDPGAGSRLRVNIFDFGGQDYYHDLHKMYYSHDTAYILLWDTVSNKYSEEVEPDPTGARAVSSTKIILLNTGSNLSATTWKTGTGIPIRQMRRRC